MNGTNNEALGSTPVRLKLGVVSPSPNNTKIRGLPAEKLERCPFCSMLLDLPEVVRRAIVELADAVAASP